MIPPARRERGTDERQALVQVARASGEPHFGRFAELLARPESEIPLDQAALLIAAHAHPDLHFDVRLAQLDALAAAATGMSTAELATWLFVTEGFSGNATDYADPRNSSLDDVLDRSRRADVAEREPAPALPHDCAHAEIEPRREPAAEPHLLLGHPPAPLGRAGVEER